MTDFTEAELETAKPQLALLHAELDAALDRQATRSAAIDTRAGLLTGAAAILGTIQLTTDSSPLLVIAIALTGLAVLAGLVVTWQRWIAEPDLPKIERMLLSREPLEALYRLIQEKQWLVTERDKVIVLRAWWVVVGYVLLATSLVAWFALSFVPGGIPGKD